MIYKVYLYKTGYLTGTCVGHITVCQKNIGSYSVWRALLKNNLRGPIGKNSISVSHGTIKGSYNVVVSSNKPYKLYQLCPLDIIKNRENPQLDNSLSRLPF